MNPPFMKDTFADRHGTHNFRKKNYFVQSNIYTVKNGIESLCKGKTLRENLPAKFKSYPTLFKTKIKLDGE